MFNKGAKPKDEVDTEEGFDPFGAVVHQQADAIAPPDAARLHPGGDPARPITEFAVGDDLFAMDDRGVVPVTIRLLPGQFRQNHQVIAGRHRQGHIQTHIARPKLAGEGRGHARWRGDW